jgi:EAL domain-containing protein (putative c-di-GMP-specific phosphodiesterase class I)
MAQEFQLVEALDQAIVNKVISLMEETAKTNSVTINLTMDSISSHAFILWLKERLTKTKIDLKLLSLSVTAYSVT